MRRGQRTFPPDNKEDRRTCCHWRLRHYSKRGLRTFVSFDIVDGVDGVLRVTLITNKKSEVEVV